MSLGIEHHLHRLQVLYFQTQHIVMYHLSVYKPKEITSIVDLLQSHYIVYIFYWIPLNPWWYHTEPINTFFHGKRYIDLHTKFCFLEKLWPFVSFFIAHRHMIYGDCNNVFLVCGRWILTVFVLLILELKRFRSFSLIY